MCVRLRTCCCCLSLEVGAQVVSIFAIGLSLAEAAYCIWGAVVLPLDQIKVIAGYIALAVLALFEFFCACVLAYGAFAKQPTHMWPWIVLAAVKGAMLLVMVIVCTTILALGGVDTYLQIILLVFALVEALLLIYLSCVVNARRRALHDESYADYSPRPIRTDSVRRVYVPVTNYRYHD